MKRLVCVLLALFYSAWSSANTCEYSKPEVVKAEYRKGAFLPVYFSRYQLDLPGMPVAFLGGNSFTAVYSERGYVGLQHLGPADMADSLPKLAPEASVSQFYRTIYGVPVTSESRNVDVDELRQQRTLMKLDCHANVVFFQLADAQVIFHEAQTDNDFHKIMVLDGNDVELITVRGSAERALQIIRSIKRRL